MFADGFTGTMEFLQSMSSCQRYIQQHGIALVLLGLGLVKNSIACPICNSNCTIQSKGVNLEPMHRCNNKLCRKRFSIRKGTILEPFSTRLEDICLVLVGWINIYPTSVIVKETGLCKDTVIKLLSCFRDHLFDWMSVNPKKIGGPGHVVEIDESAFGKRKYNRGRAKRVKWVVGGIDRDTGETFLALVDYRDAATLDEITCKFVEQGTTIITDMWRGYNNLNDLGYFHHTVNHSTNFVDPNDRTVHTQRIECHWSVVKRSMRRRLGKMSVTGIESYLVEYMWRSAKKTELDRLQDFLTMCQSFYT